MLVALGAMAATPARGSSPEVVGASAGARDDWELLVADGKNDTVYKVGLDGRFSGEFLDPARRTIAGLPESVWSSPRGLALVEGADGPSVWMASRKGLTRWTPDGRYIDTLIADTAQLEDPAGLVVRGEEVFVLSSDKKLMLVLDISGRILRRFGSPQLRRARDLDLAPDGLLVVAAAMSGAGLPLVTAWDPAAAGMDVAPRTSWIAADAGDDGPLSANSLVFIDNVTVLVADFSRGRVERRSLVDPGERTILLSSPTWGTWRELERGPDGLVYVAGPAGVYRFDPTVSSEALQGLEPFFDASAISPRPAREFSPTAMLFLRRAAPPVD
jgi:hypothetical protein